MDDLNVDDLRKKANPLTGELIKWCTEKKMTDDPIVLMFMLSQALRLAINVVRRDDPSAGAAAERIVINEITR